MSQDKIEIRNLLIRGILAVKERERSNKQDILVNVVLFTNLRTAGASDDLEESVNYRTVTKEVVSHVEGAKRFTVEALATDLARKCLHAPGVERGRSRVEKPGAVRFAESVGVEIERSIEDFA